MYTILQHLLKKIQKGRKFPFGYEVKIKERFKWSITLIRIITRVMKNR